LLFSKCLNSMKGLKSFNEACLKHFLDYKIVNVTAIDEFHRYVINEVAVATGSQSIISAAATSELSVHVGSSSAVASGESVQPTIPPIVNLSSAGKSEYQKHR
jgi:hypothetical protein